MSTRVSIYDIKIRYTVFLEVYTTLLSVMRCYNAKSARIKLKILLWWLIKIKEDFYDITKIDVGDPFEEYHIRSDAPVYEREFSRSLVLLNPTDSTYTLTLDGNYETIDGQHVSDAVLSAKSGLILNKVP